MYKQFNFTYYALHFFMYISFEKHYNILEYLKPSGSAQPSSPPVVSRVIPNKSMLTHLLSFSHTVSIAVQNIFPMALSGLPSPHGAMLQ